MNSHYQQGQLLRFGQTISFSPIEDQRFCITGDGFIKTKAIVRVLYEIDSTKLGSGCIFFQSLFQIYPSFTTSKLDQAQHLGEDLNKHKFKDENKRQLKIQELEDRVIQEYKINIETTEKTRNQAVSFTQAVQFLHVASNKFLACNCMEADAEKENFKLELNEFPSEETLFRFVPAYSHQSRPDGYGMGRLSGQADLRGGQPVHNAGEHLQRDEAVRAPGERVEGVRQLADAAGADAVQLPEPEAAAEADRADAEEAEGGEAGPGQHPRAAAAGDAVPAGLQEEARAGAGVEGARAGPGHPAGGPAERGDHQARGQRVARAQERVGALHLHRVHLRREPGVLRRHTQITFSVNMLVWLHHLESNSILVTLKNQHDDILVSLQSQSTNDQLREFIGNTNGMWYIENENFKEGGIVEWGQALRLRHFSLGKYLAIKSVGHGNEQNSCFYLSDQPNDNSLVAFHPLPSAQQDKQAYITAKYVTKDAFFKLKTAPSNEKTQWVQFNYGLNVLLEEDVSIVMIKLSDLNKDDDVLKCYKANLSEIQETSFLISCFPIMRKNLMILKQLKQLQDPQSLVKQIEKLRFHKKVNQLTKVLEDLNKFCNNQLINTQIDIKNNKQANQNRQKVLREQYFIEILLEILKYISSEEELKLQQDNFQKQKKQNTGKSPSKEEHVDEKDIEIKPVLQKLPSVSQPKQYVHAKKIKDKILVQGVIKTLYHQVDKQYYNFLNQKVVIIKLIYKLLISICMENNENEKYVYKKIPEFQYQAKFFQETTDFIISLLQGNEQLLSNLTDDVRINEKKHRNSIISADQLMIRQPERKTDSRFSKESLDKNIVFFYKKITEESFRNLTYLEFFRTICKFKNKGLSVNQEFIFKFVQNSVLFKNSLFIPITIDLNRMKVETTPSRIQFAASIKENDIRDYLVAQLRLYSDLALQRNYLWKTYLEKIFPIQFVFDQIFDDNISIQLRSAFCNLALTVYVDHEPFNPMIVPNLCRLIDNNKAQTKNQEKEQKYSIQRQIFQELIEGIFKYIVEIENQLQLEMAEKSRDKQKVAATSFQYNELTLDILKLAKTLIQFDILTLINQREKFSFLVPSLMQLLEYDKNNMVLPFILHRIRSEKKTQANQTQILVKMKGYIDGAITGVTDLGRKIAGQFKERKRKKDALEEEFAEYQTTIISKNPILASLITITNIIQSYSTDQDEGQAKIDIEIKMQICELLIFIQELRIDFLISNFLSFYSEKGKKLKGNTGDKDFDKKIETELLVDIVTIIPPTLRTGIEEIDTKQKEKSGTLISAMGDMMNSMGKYLKQQKKFTNYCGPDVYEMPDLDTLMSGQQKDILKLEMLPSMLATFHISNDSILLNKIMEVIRRMFSQKQELIDNLEQLEILFEQSEINCYYFLQGRLQELRIQTESSEVWLVEFSSEPNGDDRELQKVLRILQELDFILFKRTEISNEMEINQRALEPGEVETISATRQKIFTFLSGQVPLINFIRDSQNQLAKILKDEYYSEESKKVVLGLLKAIYKCLAHYCVGNQTNQNILYSYIDFFLDEIEQDFGQIELVCTLFQDNRFLCESFPDSLLHTLINYVTVYGRQARFLSPFKVIQQYKKQNLVENQIRILNLFLPHNQTQQDDDLIDQNEFWLYGQFTKSQGVSVLKFEFSKTHHHKTTYVTVDQPFLYHSKIIEVLLQTTVGEESFKLNSPKLKNVFKLGYLIELLLEPDDLLPGYFKSPNLDRQKGFSQLKFKINLLINWIYLNNELTHQEIIIREQTSFIKIFAQEKDRLSNFVKTTNPQPYISYFFDSLILLLTNFAGKMIQRDVNQEYRDREDFEHLFQMVKIIMDYSNHALSNQLNNHQYHHLVKFVTSVDENYFRENGVAFSQCLRMESNHRSFSQLEENRGSILKKMSQKESKLLNQQDEEKQAMLNANSNPELNMQQSPQSGQNKRFRQDVKKVINLQYMQKQSNQNWFNFQVWNKFLNFCKQNKELSEEMQNEVRVLALAMVKIDKLIPEAVKKSLNVKLEFKDILKKMIRYIEYGIINKANKENLIYSLQILEEILVSADNLEEMQNLFDQHQATKMILNLIADYKSYPFDDDFFNQLLAFGCKLSENGNKKVQKTIYNYFANMTKSESIFFKINSIISEHIDELKLKQKMQNEEASNANTLENNLLDHEIHADAIHVESKDDNSTELQNHFKIRQQILERLLRFLQLFCEGHNLELQNYIRYQFNSRNHYNLVQSIVELLYIENFYNIIRCLDTLTEFVQGPCSLNQQTIIDSKFLEIANEFLKMNISKKRKSESKSNMSNYSDEKTIDRKSNTNLSFTRQKSNKSTYLRKTVNPPQLERWMLERIKYKSMVLVSSLLELNSDSLAIKRIMRSLPIEILKDNLKIIYKRYKKLHEGAYINEALKHIDANPSDNSEKEEYHEVILETGFYIYFLISYYSELDTQEIDFETSTELQDIKLGQKEKDGGFLNMKNNLIGQLALFAYAIIGGILSTINNIRTMIQKKIQSKLKKEDPEEQEKKNQMKKQLNQEIFRETIKFFAYNSAHIEVIRNDQIEKIPFFKLPHCHYLPDETKAEFHENVSRDSVNAKISGLVDESSKIIEICKHEEQLALFFNKNKFIAIFANYVMLWKDLAFLLTLALNVFIILSYYDGDSDLSEEQRYKDRINKPRLLKMLSTEETQNLFSQCGIIMIVCSNFVVLFFLCKKGPLYVREAWNQTKDLLQQDKGLIINTFLQLFTIGNCIVRVLLNIDVLYYLTYGTLAFIATMIHPFFFAFHLSEVVIRYPTLRNIIRSFWEPKKALLLTFFLIILFNYFFTIFGYTFFNEIYDGKCESMLLCFMETFDKAFKNNGGIGGWFDANEAQDPENYEYGRFIFDNLYNIVIVMIMIQIFSGIIIDTFSSLREKSIIKNKDIQEICFICGHTRELFDRKSDSGFYQHTKNEHYMWNYIFYISYLRDKDFTEYTGIESYIAEKLKNYDHSWFPIHKALGLQNQILDSHHHEAEKLKEIENEMMKVKKNVNDILETIEELEKKKN